MDYQGEIARERLLPNVAKWRSGPFAVFESADLGAAKRTFKALSTLASARQPKNSLGVWKLALQGEVPPGAAGAGAMNSRGSNLNGWRSIWRVTVAYAGCAGLSSRFRSPGSMKDGTHSPRLAPDATQVLPMVWVAVSSSRQSAGRPSVSTSIRE